MTASAFQPPEKFTKQPASAPEQGIAMLIEMAEQGEINPWDVQVIDVIDRFLHSLAVVPDLQQNEREVALSQSGQAFLYASMLVLLKADTLARLQEDATSSELALEAEPELLEEGGLSQLRSAVSLEKQIRRRAVAQPPQKRSVTLQELIEQLQVMANEMKDRPQRPRTKRHRPKNAAQAARAIAGLAHQENLTEVAAALDQFLCQRWPEISPEQEWVNLDQLLSHWQPASVSEAHHSPHSQRVAVFWALLLLSSQSKVELLQTEFYQEIKIRVINESETDSDHQEQSLPV